MYQVRWSGSFHITQSQYTDTGPTSPSTDPITPDAWQGRHWSANFLSHWYDSTPEKSRRKRDSNPGSSAVEVDALTTRPTRRREIRAIDTCFPWSLSLLLLLCGQLPNSFLTRKIPVSYFPCIKYVGLAISVTCPVYRHINDEASSFGIGLKGMYISSVSSV